MLLQEFENSRGMNPDFLWEDDEASVDGMGFESVASSFTLELGDLFPSAILIHQWI